jgi:hypothetical protein
VEGELLVLGELWFWETGFYVVGELGRVGDGLDTEEGGAEVGVGGLVEVKGLEGVNWRSETPKIQELQYL